MTVTFGDTCFFQAMCDPEDDLHEKASEVYKDLKGAHIYTSELVIVELLNAMSTFGSHLRSYTLDYIDGLRSSSDVEIVPFSSSRLAQAQALYKRMSDKKWGVTDCDSILICRQRGISKALTYDHNFEQAQLTALLRD